MANKKSTPAPVKKNQGGSAVAEKTTENNTKEAFKPDSNVKSSTPIARPKTNTTIITITYDVGFGNTLFIRGQGAGLNWEKGIALKNKRANEWVYETKETFAIAEFKVLINDKVFEAGPNHVLKCGVAIQYIPKF